MYIHAHTHTPQITFPFIFNGHSGYFHLLTIVNSVTRNDHIQLFAGTPFSVLLDLNLGVKLLSHMVILCLI